MTRKPLPSEPEELLRRLASEPVPSAPEDASPERRERLVRSMKDAVEQSAERSERRRRWRRGLATVAVAAGFLLAAGFAYRGQARNANIAGLDRVTGTVVLTHDGSRQVVGGAERQLNDGDSVQTAAGARARLSTAKASVSMSESTEIKLSRPSAAEERISLRRGRVDVAVDKAIETTRSVVVETPDAEVVVRGTVFDVRVEPTATATSTHVHVTRGSVWVLAQGVQVALLSAGQSWSSLGGVATSPTPTAAAPAPTLAVPPAPAPSAAVSEAAAERSAARKAPAATVREPGPRKPGTLAEENRLFAAGVEARNRGDATRAAELFGELLSAYPQSALRESAQVERFRALSRAGQATRAATEARRYLAEHPEGFGRTEARDLAIEKK